MSLRGGVSAMRVKKERIEYLDLLKGISIILVVFCHKVTLSSDTILGNIIMATAWAAVPNFFFVTGGLMHQSKELKWEKYLKKVFRAYVILCIWKLLYLLFYSTFQEITFSKIDLVKYLFMFGDISGVETGHLWFMYAYLFVLLFYPISWFLFKNEKDGHPILIFLLVILFAGSILVTSCNFIFKVISDLTGIGQLTISVLAVFPFGRYGNMLFFFIAGGFLLFYREKIKKVMDTRNLNLCFPILTIIIGTLGLVFVKHYETGTFTWNNTYLTNGYSRLMTVVLSLGLYLLIQNLPVKKAGRFLAKWFGTNTMGIYYLHMPLLVFSQVNLGPYFEEYYSFGANILKTFVALLICTGITLVLKRIPGLKVLVE